MKKKYSADFETTTDPNDCRVWAWSICNVEDVNDIYYGNDIGSFILKCQQLANCDLYFHNLRFDSQFIIWYLLKSGFKYAEKDKMKTLTFNTLINGDNQIYELEICFKAKYMGSRAYYKKVAIFDSLKKLPFTVKKIAKDFQLPVQKLTMDYMAPRERGHIFTKDEQDYLRNDVEIMARALKIQFDQGLTKMTIGADALSSYKRIIGEDNFKHWFPVLDPETDRLIRKAYRGGWTYVNPMFQNQDLGAGKVYDVNSLYPWAMRYNTYPIGLPMYFEGQYQEDLRRPLYIQKFTCEFKIKKGFLPCVQIKNSLFYNGNEYLIESNGIVDLTMCNVDLELFFDHYDVWNINYICYWSFHAKDGVFNDYIDTWYKVKENSTGAIKQVAKLMLNNLYGKFATSPEIIEKIPVVEDDVVKYIVDRKYIKDAVYVPVGIFCTAYARNKTIRTAQMEYERFVYADTDSVHLVGDYEPEEMASVIDDKKLGYWKNESNFVRGRFLKAKAYVEEELTTKKAYEDNQASKEPSALIYERDGKYYHLNVKCAGMNDAIKQKVTYDNFKAGFSEHGKLVPKNVKGGVVLQDTEFTIKDFEINKISE